MPEGRTLRIMTWNLLVDRDRDPFEEWEARAPRLASMILGHRPDVLGTQEALPHQLEDLAALLPGYSHFGSGRGGRQDEASAVFYEDSLVELLEGGTFWLSDRPEERGSSWPGSAFPRICTWGRFRPRDGGPAFLVYNTHLDHEGAEARLRGAILIAGRASSRSLPGEAVFLIGDFNAARGDAPIDFLESAYRDASAGLGPSYHDYGKAQPGEAIDHVFYGPSSAASLVAASMDKGRPGGIEPSDHFPLICDFELAGGDRV
jgi:endonuclease/exonuclease/phosphatase family metal-dependent hydrolase